MANRSGSFGKRPRLTSGNPSSYIRSLVNQQDAADWSAIQDAWKNGGTWDGQQVTDAVILAYMSKRRDAIGDTSDPEYQTWNNNVQQMQFSIDEAKIGLQFKQGSLSAAGVAAWYKSQLSKYPVDSQVYRTIAGQAADWAKSAASAAGGSAGASVTKALNARLYANDAVETAFNEMSRIVMDEAVRQGIADPQSANDPSGMHKITDPARFQAMLDQGVLGPNGQRITTADWNTALKSVYLAYNDDAAAYTQAGPEYANAKNTALNNQSKFSDNYVLPTNALGIETSYQVARDQWGKGLDAAQGNPDAIAAANAKYVASLNGLVTTAGRASLDPMKGEIPPEMIGGMNNEVNLLTTGTATGLSWADMNSGGSSDTSETQKEIQQMVSDQALLASGHGFYGQAKPGAPYSVIDASKVSGAGVNDQGGVTMPNDYQRTTISLNGVPVEVWLQGRAEYATAVLDKSTGKFLTATDLQKLSPSLLADTRLYAVVKNPDVAKPIGYTFYDGNSNPTKYGVLQSDGTLLFTATNPFTGGLGDGYNIVGATGGLKAGSTSTFDPGFSLDTSAVRPVVAPGGAWVDGALAGSTALDITSLPERPGPMAGGNGVVPPAATPDAALQPGQTWNQPTAASPMPIDQARRQTERAGNAYGVSQTAISAQLTPLQQAQQASGASGYYPGIASNNPSSHLNLLSPTPTSAPAAPVMPQIKLPALWTGQTQTPGQSWQPTASAPFAPPTSPTAPPPGTLTLKLPTEPDTQGYEKGGLRYRAVL
jgi:hypothetical protein